MNVGELQTALLIYPDARKIIVVIEGSEETAFSIASVDEIRDDELGMPVVIIACAKIAGVNDFCDTDDD